MRNGIHLHVTADGLCCFDPGEGPRTISWESIQQIEGFKRDQITSDLICLLIRYDDGAEKTVEINEDMEGFGVVESELERRKFLKSSWREYVTLPPFQQRKFVLFTSAARRTGSL
jgi:hypothetical protein